MKITSQMTTFHGLIIASKAYIFCKVYELKNSGAFSRETTKI